MALMPSDPNARTIKLSPKVGYPAIALLALGIILCVFDQLGVIDVDDELWLGIIGSALGTLGIGFASPPALQEATLPVSVEPAAPGSTKP